MFTTTRNQLIALSIAAAGVLTVGVAVAAAGGQQATADNTTAAPIGDTLSATGQPPTSVDIVAAASTPGAAPSPSESNEPVGDEPSDEVDEPEAAGEPGVVEPVDPVDPPVLPPVGGPTDLAPVPKPTPPTPTIPGPVDLTTPPPAPHPSIDDLVAPIDATPFDGPTDFQVIPLPGHLDTLSSGLTGCELECVVTALLTANDVNPTVHLAVETTVPVHFEVEVAKVGGTGSTYFNNPGYDTSWNTALSPLQPDTTYDLTLIAIDQDGHSKIYEHQFTTVDIVDGFAGNAQGCALQCLVEGTVDKTDSFDTVEVHLGSNSSAALTVWVSTSEPGWVGDIPLMPAEAVVFDSDTPSTSWTFDVDGLAGETTYHIVVRAEDDWGVDHQIGTFVTDQEPPTLVEITFEKIHVLYDGDSGSLNKGELSFSWGFDGTSIGHRSEEKMHAGTVITLGGDNGAQFAVSDELSVPNIGVAGSERDWDGKTEFCAMGYGIPNVAMEIDDCDAKINVAQLGGGVWYLADVESAPTCASMGETIADADARCAWIGTPNHGGDYARFNVLISFSI
jgi:hypothetical protein